MSFTIKGILHKIFQPKQKSEKFTSREFVIETPDEKYPQFIKFQLTQDRCGLIDNFKEGEEITVHFDLRGREWNEKYFTNLNAWRIEGAEQTATEVVSSEDAPQGYKAAANSAPVGEKDDLPF
jgi:single-strand DNA-binding protein